MQRKKFIQSGLVLVPALALPSLLKARSNNTNEPFKVGVGKSRFNEKLTFREINTQDIKVSSKDTSNRLTVLEYIGREKTGPPLHIHFHQDEIFFIAEGKFRFAVGDKEIMAVPGDTIFLPRNIPHTWIQLTDFGRQIYMLQPDGTFEDFLRAAQAMPKKPSSEDLQKLHLDHGMKLLGPPLTL